MTTIRDLPQETLYMILKNLGKWSIEPCRKVCKAWYVPAHVVYLEEVDLEDTLAIKQFISAIDYNPDTKYLKAVKVLHVTGGEDYEPSKFRLNKEVIAKLFTRFPNLTDVWMDKNSLLEEFSDAICRDILKYCPKLKQFDIRNDYGQDSVPEDCGLLYKARLLVTSLEVYQPVPESQFGNTTQFLCSFPRLQELIWQNRVFIGFATIFPVLQQLPDLTVLALYLSEDEEGFAEQYLATQLEPERNLLIERLSKVTFLEVQYESVFCENHLIFIAKYLTGLENLNFNSAANEMWSDNHQAAFCNAFLDLVSLAKYQASFSFCVLELSALSNCLSTMMNKMFGQRSNSTKDKRLLVLTTTDSLDDPDVANLEVRPGSRIELAFENTFAIARFFANSLRGQAIPQCDIDVLLLEFPKKDSCMLVEVYQLLENVLKVLPPLKNVILDLLPPALFNYGNDNDSDSDNDNDDGNDDGNDSADHDDDNSDSNSDSNSGPGSGSGSNNNAFAEDITFLSIEEITLQATLAKPSDKLLDRFSTIFPGLKRLNIYYFSGTWNQYLGEFQIILPRYSLEKLSLDLTPLCKKKDERKKIYGDQDFFVVEVETLSKSKLHLYKISFNKFSVTSIQRSDLNGFVIGKDYLRARVVINSLKTLELDICLNGKGKYLNALYNSVWVKQLTIPIIDRDE